MFMALSQRKNRDVKDVVSLTMAGIGIFVILAAKVVVAIDVLM